MGAVGLGDRREGGGGLAVGAWRSGGGGHNPMCLAWAGGRSRGVGAIRGGGDLRARLAGQGRRGRRREGRRGETGGRGVCRRS